LLKSAQELLNEITNSNIDSPLKIFLTVRLEEVCRAIRHYSIGGSDGLRNVIESNIGDAILRNAGLVTDNASQLWLQRFIQLMFKAGTLLGISADVDGFLLPSMSNLIQKVLPSGD